MVTFLESVTNLIAKFNKTGDNWEKALENKQDELLEIQVELQAKLESTGELKRMVLLGEVTEETFASEQQKLDSLEAKKTRILKDMELIQQYKTDDLQAVYTELEESKNKSVNEAYKETDKLRYELLQAKLEYLQKMAEVSKRYNKLTEPERLFQQIKIAMGKQKQVYLSGSHEALHQVGTASGSYIGLSVEQDAVYNALGLQQVSDMLLREVENGKKKGFIK